MVRVGALKVSPLSPASACAARRSPSLPWALVPHLRRYDAPLRLPACPSRGTSRVARAPIPCVLSCVRDFPYGRVMGSKPPTTPGLVVTRSPFPGVAQGDRWLSHVPELPRWMHAPLFDPGGVLPTRHHARRAAAFRPLKTVGFPLHTTLRDILVSTTLLISGLHHAACLLAPSSFVHPWLGVHVEVAPDRRARLSSGGTCALALTHWVTTTHFMRSLSIPRFRAYLGATSAMLGVDQSTR